jgi:hypothetical protein
MNETTPPAANSDLYAPRPTISTAPGLTPLGKFALVLGAASVIALGTLMSGHSLPGVAAIRASSSQPTQHATVRPHPIATPHATRSDFIPTPKVIPSDGEMHATVEQETRRLVAQVGQARKSGDKATLAQLTRGTQRVIALNGVPVWERVIFSGDASKKSTAFWVIASTQDSTGKNYTFAYSSHTGKYLTEDPTLQSSF